MMFIAAHLRNNTDPAKVAYFLWEHLLSNKSLYIYTDYFSLTTQSSEGVLRG